MERAILVYTTFPGLVEAEAVSKVIVECKLAASVNILPGAISYFWWKGRVERAEEAIAIFKTRESLAARVSDAIREHHSYTTPAIIVLPLESVELNYLDWLINATRPATM